MTTYKSRETRARRQAKRRGLILSRSRTRDPYALDYGQYALIEARQNLYVTPFAHNGRPWGLTLPEVEQMLEYAFKSARR